MADKPAPDHITAPHMRRLNANLTAHGMSGRADAHDYLTAELGRPITSRNDLTDTEALQVSLALEAAPRRPNPELLGRLREHFPAEAIGKLPRSTCKDCSDPNVPPGKGTCGRHDRVFRCNECGNVHSGGTMHIDYVGHADVTDRLLSVDPHWTWRHFTSEEIAALPPEFRKGLWIHLTVLGITRPGYGDAENGKGPKEAIGDAIRNAAMRFGVALELWVKGDREWAATSKVGTDQHPDEAPPTAPATDPVQHQPMTGGQMLARIDAIAEANGSDRDQYTKGWRDYRGVVLEAMDGMSADELREIWESLERQVAEGRIKSPNV